MDTDGLDEMTGNLRGGGPWDGDAVDAHIRLQRRGDYDGAVGLLIIVDDCDPGAADGQAGTVQSVDEITFAAGFWLEADAGAARLESFAIGAGRNFAEFVAGGEPDFEVVGF